MHFLVMRQVWAKPGSQVVGSGMDTGMCMAGHRSTGYLQQRSGEVYGLEPELVQLPGEAGTVPMRLLPAVAYAALLPED